MSSLWYKEPAKVWEEALPLGNGRIGAMIFGGVEQERIQVNEESIWYGGPVDRNNPDAKAHLEEIRQHIFEGRLKEAQRLMNLTMSGCPDSMHPYQTLGDINIYSSGIEDVENYKRSLNLEEAVCLVEFDSRSVHFKREMFLSYPKDCLVIRFTADKSSQISFQANLSRGRYFDGINKLGENGICLYGNLGRGGSDFVMGIKAWAKGGVASAVGGNLCVQGADEVLLTFCAASSFRNKKKCDELLREIEEKMNNAAMLTYEELFEEHKEDYRTLFARVEFQLDGVEKFDVIPTNERIERAAKETPDIGLSKMLFDYGRYLLISCSRPGGLPATLQGIWNQDFTPPWESKYTININTEMNYWMAEKANLSDCHMPLLELIERTSKKGEKTAQDVYHLAGWVSHHNLDIWGHSSPVGQFGQDENPCTYSMWPMSSGWLCCHLWEHYCYTLDEAFLKKKAFPIIQGAVEFYLGYLVPYKGYYVTAPSTSPENTFLAPDMTTHSVTFASTMDISILRELFGLYLKACEILGVEDFTNAVKNVLQKLPPYKIGKEGQLQEWFYDYPEADINHRHISHLFGLYPGNQIHKENEPLIEACRTSLERRGDKGTGWCMAWKACLWAKLGDGNHALTLLKNQLRLTREEACSLVGGGIYPNMLCAHPPFQIDGNFGFAAAVLEMLVQYEEQKIVFLPALPDEWKDGMAEGVKAPGNITLNFKWKEKRVTEINLKSPIDAKLVILYNGMEEEIVLNAGSSYQKTLI